MKCDRTIKKHLKELRTLIDDDATDVVTRRVAYEVECAIRWAREDTVGWETPVESVAGCVSLLVREQALDAMKKRPA